MHGKVKWSFSAKDIFVTQAGTDAMKIFEDRIEVADWGGKTYILNEDGHVTR